MFDIYFVSFTFHAMNRLLLPVIFLLLATELKAQISSSCTSSAMFRHAYERDAQLLAIGRMYAVSSPDTALIRIPQRDVDSILNAMAAICNLDSVVHADSVFRKYCIHMRGYPNVMVVVDTNDLWSQRLSGMATRANDSAFYSLMTRYGYTFKSSYYLSGSLIVTLTTDQVINYKRFIDSVAAFPGVWDCRFDHLIGESNEISYQRNANAIFEFTLGWGDCPSGCNNHEVWTYSVDSACNVTLLSATVTNFTGAPLPYPTNCNLFPYSTPVVHKPVGITIQPNPVSDLLHISSATSSEYQYNITDMYGRTLVSGTLGNNTVVSTSHFAPGMYLLRAWDSEGGQTTQTFVKQ